MENYESLARHAVVPMPSWFTSIKDFNLIRSQFG
jgi:hypothetical protein